MRAAALVVGLGGAAVSLALLCGWVPRALAEEAKPPPAPPPPVVMPTHVDVCLTSVVIAPTKADGSPWDGPGAKLAPLQVQTLDKLFADATVLIKTNPAVVAATVANVFKQDIVKAAAKPDVFGTMESAPQGAYGAKGSKRLAVASPKRPMREFSPSFGDSVCFKDLAWNAEMRFRINLTDQDLVNDDPIGTVEVIGKELEAAFAHQKGWHVPVWDQDTHQIKFAVVSVTKGVSSVK